PSRHAPVCYLVLTDTATPDPFPLALHDALPISLDATDEEPSMPSPTSTPEERSFDRELRELLEHAIAELPVEFRTVFVLRAVEQDRKSTRLNSSHVKISYAVFCVKKTNKDVATA